MKYITIIIILFTIPLVLGLDVDTIVKYQPSNSNVSYNFSVNRTLDNITLTNESFIINSTNFTIISNRSVNITIVDIVSPYRLVEAAGSLETITPLSGKQNLNLNYTWYYLRNVTAISEGGGGGGGGPAPEPEEKTPTNEITSAFLSVIGEPTTFSQRTLNYAIILFVFIAILSSILIFTDRRKKNKRLKKIEQAVSR